MVRLDSVSVSLVAQLLHGSHGLVNQNNNIINSTNLQNQRNDNNEEGSFQFQGGFGKLPEDMNSKEKEKLAENIGQDQIRDEHSANKYPDYGKCNFTPSGKNRRRNDPDQPSLGGLVMYNKECYTCVPCTR